MKYNKLYRYLEIMNFGDGDKRTSVMTSFTEKSKEELNHIISDYKVTLKLTENQYKEIATLLRYKGEYSYNELKAKVSVLTQRIDKATELIKNGIDFKSLYFIRGKDEEIWKIILADNLKEELLEVLGGK